LIRLKKSKKVVKSVDEFSLTQEIDHYLGVDLQAENANYHSSGFHLSGEITAPPDTPNFCLRRLEIERRYAKDIVPWKPGAGLQRIFDNGTYMHRRYQHYLTMMGDGKTKGLYGRWVCTKCAASFFTFAPQKCRECKAKKKHLSYREYPFRHKELDILSTCDGLWWQYIKGEWYEFVVELKSIKSNGNYGGDLGFGELIEPIPKHYWQTQGYIHLRKIEHTEKRESGALPFNVGEWPKLVGGLVIYENKESNALMKEYFIKPDKAVWAEITERIRTVQKHEANNKWAPRICETLQDGIQRKCGVRQLCFKKKKDS
jgi:hypothetical protein